MSQLMNCPDCGRLFVANMRDICTECYQKQEELFEIVYRFIRQKENRQATMEEVSSATGVDKENIFRFVKEGRLRVAEFPNLWYPCESCAEPIREGRFCSSCRQSLQKDVENLAKEEAFQVRKHTDDRMQTYFSDRKDNG
ncbi:MAG TPA: TIGR03826 family flagellar region protein [Bacillales bacterium]|nr:TIGR03826 family flagellar region protein [Bacillales bacterium]